MERGKQSWVTLSRVDRIHPVTHRHQAPLVPRGRVRGITERITARGEELVPLHDADVEAATRELLDQGIDSLVILFLWSFLADTHERRAKAIAAEVAASRGVSIPIFCSSEVSPTLRELPRANAATVEAFAGPSTLQCFVHGRGRPSPIRLQRRPAGDAVGRRLSPGPACSSY